MTTAHKPATPLPWALTRKPSSGGGQNEIEAAPGNILKNRLIAVNWSYGDADDRNAAYIAHACNSYPRLVEALRNLREAISNVSIPVDSFDALPTQEVDALLRELGEAE